MMIPRDIIFEIAKWLDSNDLVAMRRVCKWINKSVVLENLWVIRADWYKLSANSAIPERYFKYVDWRQMAINHSISEEIFEKYAEKLDRVCWNKIIASRLLSERFIDKYFDKFDIWLIALYQRISNQFIEKHPRLQMYY